MRITKSMKNQSALNMLSDVILELYEIGQDARAKCKEAERSNTDAYARGFSRGIAFGYYEVLNHIKNQSEVFGIYNEISSFSKVDPDELLK